MQGDTRRFPGGVEGPERTVAPMHIRLDPAHLVMHPGADRYWLFRNVYVGDVVGQFPNLVQLGADQVRAQVPAVEQHTAVNAPPLVNLGLLGAGDHVARGQLHRVRRAITLVGHEAVAVGVEQVGALTAGALGDKHAVGLERGGMVLHHLHVHQRRAERGRPAPYRRRCRSRHSCSARRRDQGHQCRG